MTESSRNTMMLPKAEQPNVFDRLFLTRPESQYATYTFLGILIIGSMESVPDWSMFGWNLEPGVFFYIATLAGGIAGALGAKDRLAGALSAGIFGAGASGSLWVLLHFTSYYLVPDFLFFAVLILGCQPGLLLFASIERRNVH